MQFGNNLSPPFSILCVEDDNVSRKFLYTSLTIKYETAAVYCAANGVEGLQLFKDHRPGIIITDINMPIMDGIKLATEIRLLNPEAVIIAVTGYSDSAFLFKAIEIGISQYILKPIQLDKLFEVIDKQIGTLLLKHEVSSQHDLIRKLSISVEQGPSSVLIFEADGTIEYVNSRFTSLTGYGPEEVLGQNIRMLKSRFTSMEAYAGLWRTIASGKVWQGELQGAKKNTVRYWASLVISPINDEDGTIHYVCVSEDITARKLAEQERESTIEFLRIVNASTGIQDMISAAISFLKAQSGCSAVALRLRNGEDYPYFAAQGFPLDFVRAENSLCSEDADGELIRDNDGNPMIDCMCGNVICGRFDPEKPCFTSFGSFWTNSTTELLAAGIERELPGPLRNRCNSQGFESMALIPLNVGQERMGLLQLGDLRKGIFSPEDISHCERMAGYLAIALGRFLSQESLKKMNEELDYRVNERTNLLETALKEQESFSYSVSHDLRAPLRHINSFLSILSEDFGELLPEEAHSFLDRSRKASLRMGKLIDDLLELSRVSRSTLVKEVVNLSELATHATDWLHETEPNRKVELVIMDGLVARGDKSLLQQVLGNLLGNAWKYTASNPAARIEFGKEVVDGREVFCVTDNGVGFDMAYKEKLFSAFQRLHGPEYEGNGIGLATVKRIMERHGGEVWAESKIDVGSKFYFSL